MRLAEGAEQCEVCEGNVVVHPAEWQRLDDERRSLEARLRDVTDDRDAWREVARALAAPQFR